MKTLKFWSTESTKDILDAEALHQFLIQNGFGTYNICSLRAPLCPRFFNVALCHTVGNDLPKIFTMF